MTQKQKLSTRFDRLRKHLDAIVAVVAAVTTLGGAVVAAGSWIISEVSAQSNQRIDQLQSDMKEQQLKQELAIMRLELMNLIENNPDNTVEIEQLGKKYFNPPYNGDSYMSTVYSQYARAHGLDVSFIVH